MKSDKNMLQKASLLKNFTDNLPHKPYCSDDLGFGLKIFPKKIALNKRYIQPNHPYYIQYFIFDLDYSTAYIDFFYSMVGIPTPNLIVENPKNGHAHYVYELETPIYKTDNARQKVIEFGNAVYIALRGRLSADLGYSGLITKNPLHESWRTTVLREKPYRLSELAENLDLSNITKPVTPDEAIGLGRNCCVFHTVRKWAYVEIRQFRSSTFNTWLACVLKKCQAINQEFIDPLNHNELKAIAKSIAKFCWKNDAYCYQEFIDRQSRKGKLGASVGGHGRSSKYDKLRLQAKELYEQGLNKTAIAVKLAISRKTITRWLND